MSITRFMGGGLRVKLPIHRRWQARCRSSTEQRIVNRARRSVAHALRVVRLAVGVLVAARLYLHAITIVSTQQFIGGPACIVAPETTALVLRPMPPLVA